MKKVIIILIAFLIVQECYFYFVLQPIAWQKVQNNEKLNLYETANVYITYTLVELSGLVISPQTTKLMLVKQFHLPLSYKDVPKKWENNNNVKKTIISLQPNQTKKIVWKDYIPTNNIKDIIKGWKNNDVAIALNGSKVTCIARDNETITVKYTILTDFAHCLTIIMGFPLYEGLFDYLENENIISTPKAEIIKTYKLADLK